MALPSSVAERLARLAPDQRAAATAPPGPVLCVAPAGSGKTTTLVARIAWRIATGTDPGKICALTFNRRAAEELGERLAAALEPLGLGADAVRVRTFHALGREILEGAGVDVTRLVDRAELLARIAGRPVVGAELRLLDDAFSRLTLDPERGPPPEQVGVHAAFGRYRDALMADGALDFDDLVARALALLRGDRATRSTWRERCSTLLVDEAQDLDRSQLDMALVLAEPARDVFLVGDDDQTIYAWRLADVRRILGLAAALPGLRRVDLETNYRCPPEVVARSVRLIEHGVERFAKRILAGPRSAGTLTLAADTGDPTARARRLLACWYGREEGTYAVLARTNAELAPYAAVALERRIAYHVADDGLLFDDPGLAPALEVLRSLEPPKPGTDAASLPWLARLAAPLRAEGIGLAPVRDADPGHSEPAVLGPTERAVVAWAARFATPGQFHAAVDRCRRAARRTAAGRRAPEAGNGPHDQGPRVRPRGGGRHGSRDIPERTEPRRGARPGPRAGGGAAPGVRGLDARATLAAPALRPVGTVDLPRGGLRTY